MEDSDLMTSLGSVLDFVSHLWHSLEKVSHQAVVRHLEDGGLSVLIDSHDDLGVLHT